MARKFLYNKRKNKKGLSTVVITVILIALSMAAVVLVWGFVNNLIKKQIGSSESCFGNYDKVQLNKQYTCYEDLGEGEYAIRFSLTIGDITVDKVIVSVSSASAVQSYELTNEETTITNLEDYPDDGTATVKLPNKNAGRTYRAEGFDAVMDLVRIAPVIGENQCEVSDSLSQIESCELLI